MGYLKDKYGFDVYYEIPKGACPECGMEHGSHIPHHILSFIYLLKFYDKYGRCPSLRDSMVHLTEAEQAFCLSIVLREGLDPDKPRELPIDVEDRYNRNLEYAKADIKNKKGIDLNASELLSIKVSVDNIRFFVHLKGKNSQGGTDG